MFILLNFICIRAVGENRTHIGRLQSGRSTIELQQRVYLNLGQGGGNRTPDSSSQARYDQPLHYTLLVDRTGFAPAFPACNTGVLLLDDQPILFEPAMYTLYTATF